MLWASCANSAPSPSTSNPWPPQTSNPPFPEKPKSLPRMLSYGAGSSLFTLKCRADFQVSPPRKRWPLGFLPPSSSAGGRTTDGGNDLGCRTLAIAKGRPPVSKVPRYWVRGDLCLLQL